MPVMPSRFPVKYSVSKWKSFCFLVLTLAFGAASGWAQAPPIVIDAQQTLGFGYGQPQGIAVSKNGTVFIADTNNNQIIALDTFPPGTGINNTVPTPGFTLSSPQVLALDASGNLFVGDVPTNGTGRLIEIMGDGNGNLTATVKLVLSGAPLTDPFALVFDNTGTLFIGDYPASGHGVIYTLAPGSSTPQLLNITGLPVEFTPASFARDAGNNLYIADNGDLSNGPGGVWVAPATGGAATPLSTGTFIINQPTGLRRDALGNIYILSFLGTGTGFNAGQQVVVIPQASPSTPYILPNSGIGLSSDMAFDPAGNLDVLDYHDGAVIQLTSASNPVNMGNVFVGKTGLDVLFNFEFNAGTTLRGFQVVTQGDASTDLIQDSTKGTCVNGKHTNLGTGGPTISPYFPYTCNEFFYGNPTYPGIRSSAIQVKGTAASILASTPAYQTGFAGVEVTYPLNQTTTATGLLQPQALAISGLNNTVYVADSQAGKVYSTKNLGGSALTPVSTGTITLSAPIALALDGAGNLFIADFNNANVIEVPTTTGLAPSTVNTGGLLTHPTALAFDFLGNLYIADAGPGGLFASNSNPGYLVKIPVGGTPFKMTIPPLNTPIVFPQALATDPYTAALLIGDGGDVSTGLGQVVQVSADGTSAGTAPIMVGSINTVTDPSGLAFDQADDLYILDGVANTITVVPGPQLQNDNYLLPFDNSTLTGASALAISAGGQSFVIANIASATSDNLVYLNGNRSALAFGGVKVGSQSPTQTASEYNIGNLALTLQSPYYTTNTVNAAFDVLGSSTCAANLVLEPSTSCSINVQFQPKITGQTTQQLTVKSDGYNGGSGSVASPILTLRGTGK
jgi:sugar lactone lactonase YvrE